MTPNKENITKDDIITTTTKIIYGKYIWKKSVAWDIELYISHIKNLKMEIYQWLLLDDKKIDLNNDVYY